MSQINNNIDPDSRDYDLKSIEPDERFTRQQRNSGSRLEPIWYLWC